jgi:hypothetical protein
MFDFAALTCAWLAIIPPVWFDRNVPIEAAV